MTPPEVRTSSWPRRTTRTWAPAIVLVANCKYSEEQIIGFLNQATAGLPVKDLCRQGGFSEATFYKWRAKYGGLRVTEAARLRELKG